MGSVSVETLVCRVGVVSLFISHYIQELVKAVKSTTLEQGIIREVVVPYEPGTMSIAEEVHERQSMLTDFSRRFGKLTYILSIFPKSRALYHISLSFL